MRDELIYSEYAGWKLEHDDFISNLKKLDSLLIFRFENVLNVIDHLYDRLIDDPNYSDDDHVNFVFGFQYVHQQIEEIKAILSKYYQNDYLALNLDAKKINLLLNTIDFQHELLDLDTYDQEAMEFFLNFEAELLDKIAKKEVIDDTMYQKLDLESAKIFKKHNLEYYPIDSLYLEIADELGIL